jgi:hypothetical protein
MTTAEQAPDKSLSGAAIISELPVPAEEDQKRGEPNPAVKEHEHEHEYANANVSVSASFSEPPDIPHNNDGLSVVQESEKEGADAPHPLSIVLRPCPPMRRSMHVQNRSLFDTTLHDHLQDSLVRSTTLVKTYKPRPRMPVGLTEKLSKFVKAKDGFKEHYLRIDTGTKRRSLIVDNLWGALVFLCNLHNVIHFFYFLGMPQPIEGWTLALALFAEVVLCFDAAVYTLIHLCYPSTLKKLPLSLPGPCCNSLRLTLGLRWLSCFPWLFICLLGSLSIAQRNSLPLFLLNGFKLVRCADIATYLKRLLDMVQGTVLTYLQLLRYLLYMLLFAHVISALWLLIARLESEGWLTYFRLDRASYGERYIATLFFVITNMAGMCYGETFPITVLERLAYCVIVFSGCTVLSALFGNLANSVYVRNARAIAQGRKLEQVKQLAVTRGLPRGFRRKLILHYTMQHNNFQRYSTSALIP